MWHFKLITWIVSGASAPCDCFVFSSFVRLFSSVRFVCHNFADVWLVELYRRCGRPVFIL